MSVQSSNKNDFSTIRKSGRFSKPEQDIVKLSQTIQSSTSNQSEIEASEQQWGDPQKVEVVQHLPTSDFNPNEEESKVLAEIPKGQQLTLSQVRWLLDNHDLDDNYVASKLKEIIEFAEKPNIKTWEMYTDYETMLKAIQLLSKMRGMTMKDPDVIVNYFAQNNSFT